MPVYVRAWLPPFCLVLAIAALWVFSGEPQCPNDPWDGSPAIGLVGGDCVYKLQFNTYLRDISLGLGFVGEGAEQDESGLGEFIRGRQHLISRFGLENAAFATMAQDVALYQAAVAEGHAARDAEAMAVMGANRKRVQGLGTLLDLHELARESDLDGFRELLESPSGGQLLRVQGEGHLLKLFEEAGNLDMSGAARGMEIHAALLDSAGEDQYWTGAFVELAGWLVAIESLRNAVEETDSSQAPGLGWLDITEETWGSTVIELTDAAPEGVTLTDVRLYMDGLLALERDLLTR